MSQIRAITSYYPQNTGLDYSATAATFSANAEAVNTGKDYSANCCTPRNLISFCLTGTTVACYLIGTMSCTASIGAVFGAVFPVNDLTASALFSLMPGAISGWTASMLGLATISREGIDDLHSTVCEMPDKTAFCYLFTTVPILQGMVSGALAGAGMRFTSTLLNPATGAIMTAIVGGVNVTFSALGCVPVCTGRENNRFGNSRLYTSGPKLYDFFAGLFSSSNAPSFSTADEYQTLEMHETSESESESESDKDKTNPKLRTCINKFPSNNSS